MIVLTSALVSLAQVFLVVFAAAKDNKISGKLSF